ncbi:MAG TPA: PKD domain-containing protein [Candidatus Nanoarchaeia archaeon]|nr:PKD domain-containing protein [Candidatus Nanoarchaeia archaeon]
MMKKLYLMSAISAAMMILLAFSVAAAVTVTYNFYDINSGQALNNVDVLGYPCNDASCSSLRLNSPLAGSGNSGTSSILSLVFPTNLASSYGYAVYYFRPGYAPQEYNADWSGTGSTTYSIPFNKIYECKSNITDLRVDNNNGLYSVTARARSAFSNSNNGVAYVPPAYNDYYSSVVDISIAVYDQLNNVVAQSTFTRNIFMDSNADVTLNLGSLASGNYTAVSRTDVNDNQCASDLQQQDSISFEVVAQPLLDVTLTAIPSSGPEPLDVLLTCSVQNGQAPYQYSFDEDGSIFFAYNSTSASLNVNRVFDQGIYNVTCSVTDNGGRTGSDSAVINVTGPVQTFECNDRADNDNDSLIDFPADPGCINATDDNETDTAVPECSDGLDNDGDSLIDFPADPGCSSPSDDDEDNLVCTNHLNIANVNMEGVDLLEGLTYLIPNSSLSNGYIAFDYGFANNGSTAVLLANYTTTMAGQTTRSESSIIPFIGANTTFVEGNDFNIPSNLADGFYNMSVVVTGIDQNNCSQYDRFDFFAVVNSTAPSFECSDGADNDSDNLTDAADPGCYDAGSYNPFDDDESDTLTECSDYFDNDNDSLIDFPADPGCANSADDNETDPTPGNDDPLVTLLFPADNSTFAIGNIIFIYGVTDDNAPLLQCTLYTNVSGSFAPSQTQWTANGNLGFFNVTGIPDGTYDWNVECSDGFNSAFAPDDWTFTINSTGYVDIPADVNITANPSSGVEQLSVQFASSVSGNAPIMYSWSFGDSQTSNQPNPQHTYTNDGTYTATLTITDADGDTASDSVTIIVTDSGSSSGDDDAEEEDSESCGLYIGRILIYSDLVDDYGEEYVRAGDELFVNVYFENRGAFNLEDVTFRALIPDIGALDSVSFDLEAGDDTTRAIMLDIPSDTAPGDYDIQISAHNDDCVSRTKYRQVTVIR